MRKDSIWLLLTSVVVLGLVAGLNGLAVPGGGALAAAPEQTAAPTPAATEQPAATPPSVEMSVALNATSGKKFPGVTVVVVGVSGAQGDFLKTAAAGWEQATGATVQLNLIPFGDLQNKVLAALSAGSFIGDVLNIPAYMDGDLMGGGYVEPVPADIQARLNLQDVMPLYRQQGLWGGTMYGYPWDGDIYSMYYRKDLISNPTNQAKFKTEFGYDLQPPRTWQQYQDVAKFFTGTWADGKQHYGSVELVMRNNQGFHGYIDRAACYAKMPNDPAFFFDPNTMDARVNNPGFVQALQDSINILPYSPPDMPNFGFVENAQAFVGGLTALDNQWADIGPMSVDPKASVVNGKVGFALSPGCTKTYDSNAKQWVDFPDINFAPYAAFGGWQNVVPKNAQQKEAAMDLAAYLGSPPILLLASLTSGSGVNPARYSTIDDVAAWVKSGFSQDDAVAYLNVIKQVQENPNAIFQLRLPGYLQYQDAVELAVSKALSKQATPQQALDEAATTWNAITDRIGRDS